MARTLNDLGDLRDLAKELHRKEKRQEAEKASQRDTSLRALSSARRFSIPAEKTRASGHRVAPDGSNATIEDYFSDREASLDNKYDEPWERAWKGPRPEGKKQSHSVLPDGSNATPEDYFLGGEAFLEDKYQGAGRKERSRRSREKFLEVDLHINALPHPSSLQQSDYLLYQMREFRKVMEENKDTRGRVIVFIHGVGDGILRRKIIDELDEVYWTCTYQDAPFHEYGMGGAIKVTIG